MTNRVQLEAVLKLIGVQVNPGVFNSISRAAAGMPGPVQQFNRNLTQSVGAANNVSKAIRGVNNQLTGSERAARLFLQRMAQFAILLPTFATLNKSIQNGVKFLFDFDAAIKDIIRVDVGKLGDKFGKIAEEAFKLSDAFGTSALEAVNTIKLFTQAGFELQKATELARLSILATKASTLDAAGATEFLLSAYKQFGLEGQNLEKALDSLVAAEDLSALEAQDIAEAFRTGGNSLAQFAKDINDSIGLISALREQTRKSGNEIGTFFKTLQTRIFAAGESRAAIEGLGVSVQNLDGSLRPTLEVLNDLKTSFDGMTEAQQANAAKSIAGVRQFESLIATLNSLERANQLSAASSNAVGAAQRKEEIDAQKLSRRLDDLIVAGQKLAFALGEAGSTDFFKNALKTITAMVDNLTELVRLLDSIKVPVLPIIAPLAFKAIGQVFGLGGGNGGGTNQTGPSRGGGPTNPLAGGQTAENTAALRQLSAVVSQLSQQLRVLTGATSSQAQAQKINTAITNTQVAATRLQVAAHQQATNWYTKSVGLYKSTIGSIQNAGLKFLTQYTLLTLGVTALTAGLQFVADKLGGSNSFLGSIAQTTSAGVQMAGQFAILGPQAAILAGLFGALSDSTSKLVASIEDNKKAVNELTSDKIHQDRLKPASRVLSGGVEGLGFLKSLGRTVEGRTNKQLDFNKSFNEAFKTLSPAAKVFIKNVEDLKNVLFDSSRGKDTIRELAKLDSAAFVNQEAIEQLRNSYDESGKSTLSFKDQLNLFFHALGQVDSEIDKTTGMLKNMIFTFKDMKDLQQLIGFAQSINKLGRSLNEAMTAPENFAQGIDKMRLEAQYAEQDLSDAQRAFEALRKSLVTQGATEAGLNPGDAEKFINQLNDMLNKNSSGGAISEFLSSRTTEERKFAEEFLKIDEDRRNAIIKSAETRSSLENEIYKRGLESVKAQKEAAFAAADALAKFQNELLKVGTNRQRPELTKMIDSLKGEDVAKVLAGKSDLPMVIQEVITSSFVDGVKKAEQNLKNIAEETGNSIAPINLRIRSLQEEIVKLGEVEPNTEKALKKQNFEQEIAAKTLERQTIIQEGYVNSLEGLHTLTIETKKAQEDAARAEADRLKKTQNLTNATHDFAKSINEVNKNFKEFVKQRIGELAEKQAAAYQEVKTAEQGVLSATDSLANTYRDYIATIIQVNGVIAEAKIKSNLLGRDIGMLNGKIVTFQDKFTSLNDSFTSVLDNANMSLEQRIQLERQLSQETLSFLQQAQDQITSAGIGVFGQSSQENQGLQKGLAGLSFIADKLGGSFEGFLGMNPQEINSLSEELLNLPVEFRKSVLDALSFLPSTTSIGGFSADQLKQAIGQIGAGVSPEAGLPALSDLTAQEVDQLKILGQLGTQEAKLQLTQVLSAQKALEKAQEQLDVAKLQEERAREGFEQVRIAVNNEMAVLEDGNIERRDLLQKVIDSSNANSLHDIENQAQLFADQNSVFREVGDTIVAGVSQAINAKMSMLEAQTSLGNFNTIQSFENQSRGYIPNFANGNITPGEAAGLLRAASREKRMMPNGANLAVANTKEAIIPMYKNFASGNDGGSAIAAGINSIRTLDQTMVAAIARSVSNTLSQIKSGNGSEETLDKIASLLTDLNGNIGQVRDSNLAIKTNTAGLAATTNSKTPNAAAANGQDVRITLQTNQNNSVQITGLENLRDQLKQALSETTSKQVAQQIEALMVQLDPIFQSLNERGIINSFGQSR